MTSPTCVIFYVARGINHNKILGSRVQRTQVIGRQARREILWRTRSCVLLARDHFSEGPGFLGICAIATRLEIVAGRLAGWLDGCTLSHRCRQAGSAALPGNQTARLPSADRSGCTGDRACQTGRKEGWRYRRAEGPQRGTVAVEWWWLRRALEGLHNEGCADRLRGGGGKCSATSASQGRRCEEWWRLIRQGRAARGCTRGKNEYSPK